MRRVDFTFRILCPNICIFLIFIRGDAMDQIPKKRKDTSPGLIKAIVLLFAAVCILFQISHAQTTGKLTGQVVDNKGEPLIGVNIVIEGTTLGASTDLDGYYIVLNVRTGTYKVRYLYLGYQTKVVENVSISADKTTKINVTLDPEAISGEEVVVTATKPLVEFNETSAISTVSKQDIEMLPVQDLTQIVNLQAGVVDGHFRGGRLGEVQYQVDGVTVNNPYDNSSTLQLDRSVLEEVQVISGTFDAKYGQAMSGVVNAVLKTGSNNFNWSGEVYSGDYYTSDKNRYPHNQNYDPSSILNFQLTLSGPAFISSTTFFASARRFINDGYLFGVRRFVPTDRSNFETRDFNPTGDNTLIPMQPYHEWSGQFKVSNTSISNIQISYQAIVNDVDKKTYNNAYRINPDGIKTQRTVSVAHGIDWTHTISPKIFYKLSLRQNYFNYTDYRYKSVFDPRYLAAGQPQGDANYAYGAMVQGVDLGRFEQKTVSEIGKADFTWQINRSNLVESGVEGQISKMSFGSPGYLRLTNVGGTTILLPRLQVPDEPGVQTYYPRQGAAYLQDRIEWQDLIVRAGLRLEYFDADAAVPDNLRNPANAISGAPQSAPKKTTVKMALAPRLGFSFPLSASASLYFSYGHFYQMPGLQNLYSNADYSILKNLQASERTFGVMGNPDLKPEFTTQYEFGLKQALTSFLGMELSFFYKDIRDLLGVEFITAYNAAEYPRFTNTDFGSVYGFTISFNQRPLSHISTTLDYTLQFARGNSSDPRETANRASAGKDPRPRDIPFNWDQRNTLNVTAIYFKPNNYTISTIIKIGSGQPYTPQIGSGFGADLQTNAGRKSGYILMDLRAEKFLTMGFADFSLYLRMYNVLNTHFVNGFVFPTTGSPDYTQFPEVERSSLIDPGRFYEPRRIEIGLTFKAK